MPRSTLAKITHPQLGAHITRKGTGTANSQPATSTRFRPHRSPRWPATPFVSALTTPKVAMNESAALRDASPNSCSASSGSTVRSSPTIAPTNALTRTSSQNCRQFSRRPSAGAVAAVTRWPPSLRGHLAQHTLEDVERERPLHRFAVDEEGGRGADAEAARAVVRLLRAALGARVGVAGGEARAVEAQPRRVALEERRRRAAALPVALRGVQPVVHRPELALVRGALRRPRRQVAVREHPHHERHVLVEHLARGDELLLERGERLLRVLAAVRAAEVAEVHDHHRRGRAPLVVADPREVDAVQDDLARGALVARGRGGGRRGRGLR